MKVELDWLKKSVEFGVASASPAMRADRFESFELLPHALRSRVRGELKTKHSLFGARPQTSVQSRAYWISLDKLLGSLWIYGFQTGRIFCANSSSQQAKGASYNLLLLLRKDCLFCRQSECHGPPSTSISLESIKSQLL